MDLNCFGFDFNWYLLGGFVGNKGFQYIGIVFPDSLLTPSKRRIHVLGFQVSSPSEDVSCEQVHEDQ